MATSAITLTYTAGVYPYRSQGDDAANRALPTNDEVTSFTFEGTAFNALTGPQIRDAVRRLESALRLVRFRAQDRLSTETPAGPGILSDAAITALRAGIPIGTPSG